MKILLINSCCGCFSTGTIAAKIAKDYEEQGYEAVVAYAGSYRDTGVKTYKIGTKLDIFFHKVKAFLLDQPGFGSRSATKKFLEWADQYNPDLLWLHNIHGYYIHVEMLFDWIKARPNTKVRWTLHDCWAFTGHCTHFSVCHCMKWKTQCGKCPQLKEYPHSLIVDNSKNNFFRKKRAFTGVQNLTIITPSNWLANLVKQSFLKEYEVQVYYNTVDKTVFRPVSGDTFRQKYGLTDRKVILGVASTWEKRKGLSEFVELSRLLGEEYKIVLVGLSDRQIKNIPYSILGLPRTKTPEELACIYSAADVFVNLSKEETFGMTTLEALLCGTDAIVYRDTACEEVANLYGGIAVEQNLSCVLNEIRRITGGRGNT